jgi:hypothetical protein
MKSTSIDQPMEPLVEAKEIAVLLGIKSPLTVLRYARSRKLPSYECPYGARKVQYKFRVSEVEAHIRTLARPCQGASSELSRAENGKGGAIASQGE